IWHERAQTLRDFLYVYENGNRLAIAPMNASSVATWKEISQTREPLVLNSEVEMAARGVAVVPGTDHALSMVRVPILGSDRVLGTIDIENFERENVFGAPDIPLLRTVAAP